MKVAELYSIFGKFDSVEEINMTAAGLLEEGDHDNIMVLAKENGLEDMASLYIAGELEELADPLMAAIGRLRIEQDTDEVKKAGEEIPAEPITEYLQSKCEESLLSAAVLKKDKSLIDCIQYIKDEAKKLVTKNKPYLADMVVFQLALDYYLK